MITPNPPDSRSLYDQDYLVDCNQTDYDPDTAVDDLFWTYITSYAVATLSLLVGCTLFALQYRKQRKRGSNADVDGNSQSSEERAMFHCCHDNQHNEPMKESSSPQLQIIEHQAQTENKRARRLLSPGLPSNLPPCYYHLLVAFFGLLALGFGATGAHQQFVSTKEDADNVYFKMLDYGGAALIGCSCWIWMAVSLLEYHVAIKGRDEHDLMNHGFIKWSLKLLAVGAVVVMLVLRSKLILGALMVMGISSSMTISLWQYIRYRHALYLSDAIAPVWYLGAIVVLVLLDHLCGSSAYKECFQDCPLPSPDLFNHKALFGVGCCAFVIHYGVDKIAMQLKVTSSPVPAQNAPYKKKTEPSELL